MCVTLNDPDDWNDHCQLYDEAFAAWENRVSVSASEHYEIPVAARERQIAAAVPERELRLFLPKEEELTYVYELPRFVYEPVCTGECAGRVIVLRGGEAAGEVKLVFTEDVARAA